MASLLRDRLTHAPRSSLKPHTPDVNPQLRSVFLAGGFFPIKADSKRLTWQSRNFAVPLTKRLKVAASTNGSAKDESPEDRFSEYRQRISDILRAPDVGSWQEKIALLGKSSALPASHPLAAGNELAFRHAAVASDNNTYASDKFAVVSPGLLLAPTPTSAEELSGIIAEARPSAILCLEVRRMLTCCSSVYNTHSCARVSLMPPTRPLPPTPSTPFSIPSSTPSSRMLRYCTALLSFHPSFSPAHPFIPFLFVLEQQYGVEIWVVRP